MGRLMTTIEARYERTPVFTSNHEGRVLILPSLRFFWAEHTSEGHQRGSSLAHEVIIRTVDMRLNYISTRAPSLVPTSCASVQKSNLQRSCLDVSPLTLSWIPPAPVPFQLDLARREVFRLLTKVRPRSGTIANYHLIGRPTAVHKGMFILIPIQVEDL